MHFDLFDAMQVPFKIIRGPLVDEVHQNFSSWIYQVSQTDRLLVAIYDHGYFLFPCLVEVNLKPISSVG